jgi:hypothetical protein
MPTLLSKTYTNNVPDSPGRWLIGEIVAIVADDHVFGSKETPESGNFHHITVEDKTMEEVQAYLQSWNHDPTTQQIQNNGDDRRIEVTSTMVSVSGKNAFTQAGVEELMVDIGGAYVSHDNTSFKFDITATLEEKDEIIEQINEAVREMQYARRRWATTPAARTFLNANGGVVSGPAATVGNYLRDGLLD